MSETVAGDLVLEQGGKLVDAGTGRISTQYLSNNIETIFSSCMSAEFVGVIGEILDGLEVLTAMVGALDEHTMGGAAVFELVK